ncbi:MAG: hypothetical protein GXO63_00580 [Candidatus Micrarchaeota archaeon]|nr:hypothetical protein [Candidatus Micrarchaeota archaeon]
MVNSKKGLIPALHLLEWCAYRGLDVSEIKVERGWRKPGVEIVLNGYEPDETNTNTIYVPRKGLPAREILKTYWEYLKNNSDEFPYRVLVKRTGNGKGPYVEKGYGPGSKFHLPKIPVE